MARRLEKTPTGRTRRDAARGDVLTALERLLERGESFTALGVQEICDEAGVARSAFYLNFSDKADALLGLVGSATQDLFRASLEWIESYPDGGFEGLVRTQGHTIRTWRRSAAVVKAYFEASQYDDKLASYWEGQLASLVEALRSRIEQRQVAGLVSAQLDPRACAEVIVYGAERLTAKHVGGGSRRADTELAHGVASMLWTLLGPPNAEPGK